MWFNFGKIIYTNVIYKKQDMLIVISFGVREKC